MAYIKVLLQVNIVYILLLSVLEVKVFGDKLEQSIYKKITGNFPCVTLLNSTHQIGCKSKRKGNVGVVHYIDSDENFNRLLNKGKYSPYIPLFTAEYFTDDRLKQLINADKVSGALVLYSSNNTINGTSPPPSGFSPDVRCPNENFGLYGNDESYSCSKNGSKSVTWNYEGSGMSYKDYDIPVFALYKKDEINNLIKCYKDHNEPVNGENPDYPLCGVELQSFMMAAKDTPTCIRKTNAQKYTQMIFCDALGDHNVWGTLFPSLNDHLTEKDVIMATTKLDSTAFFHGLSPGADNTGTGIVVLLAAADALGNLKRNGTIKHPDLKKNQKHIMFSFFHGEAWDYIGSSRMVYDMLKGDFPAKNRNLPNIGLTNIAYYLELSQVGLLDEKSLWAHRDPKSKDDVRKQTETMFDTLSKFGVSVNLSIKDPSQNNQPLPPSSFQRFLKGNRSIPGLVIADHKSTYTNKFYNSRFDDFNSITQNFIVKRLTKLATTVAKTLYELAYNEKTESIVANEKLVDELLHCLLKSSNCSLFKNAVTEKNAKTLNKQNGPMPRYVGPYASPSGQPSGISVLTKYLLAYFTGIRASNYTKCPAGNDSYFVYSSTNGTWSPASCILASVYFSDALSPAFYIESQTTYLSDDYDPKEYSTWTESRWTNDIGIRMFLIADPAQEVVTLVVGLILTLLSLVVTVFVYRKAEQLFTPGDRVLVINSNDM